MEDLKFNKIKESCENKIINAINKDNHSKCTVHFNYSHDNSNMTKHHEQAHTPKGVVEIVTYNPINKVKFLLHRCRAKDLATAIDDATLYILKQSEKNTEYSYTVEWKVERKGESLRVSYFRGKNEREVLEKFYHDEDTEKNIRIYSLKLNPIS